ncbi:MAG: hypothetical protein ACJ766_14415, partial [Thermoleophilaceae bacterium]
MGRARAPSILCGTAATLVVAALLGCSIAPASRAADPRPYSAHSMIYTCCTPPALEQRMFAEAKAMGSSFIRLDVEMAPIFEAGGAWRPQPDWIGLDRVEALSRQYGLPVVGVLRATPTPLSTCPEGPDPGECSPSDYGRYGSLAGQIASHARGTIRYWEVL